MHHHTQFRDGFEGTLHIVLKDQGGISLQMCTLEASSAALDTFDVTMSSHLSQGPAATLGTWIMHVCERLLMTMAHISWQIWHTSVDWWRLAWYLPLLNTAMW